MAVESDERLRAGAIEPTPDDLMQLRPMLSATWISQSIYAAAKLGISDLLAEGSQPIDELARATGCHEPSLYRLMRALASVGIYTESAGRTFALTPLAACLRTNAAGSLRSLAIFFGEEPFRSWADILYSLETGTPAFEQLYGSSHYDYLAVHPDAAQTFNSAMSNIASIETAAIAEQCGIDDGETVVDVGAGEGSLLTTILRARPRSRGVLFDLPHVVEAARARLDGELSSRCELVAGDFFDSIPAGGDVYVMKAIVHAYHDPDATRLLRGCRRAMGDRGRLLVGEYVVPEGNEPAFGKLLDMLLLVTFGGRERTEREYRELFEGAGLRLTKVLPTSSPVSILVAEPA